MRAPFFSIIIPTNNSATTISTCLQSVIKQKFQDFEVLIIDRISSDDTISIVKKYSELNKNIHWISEKDEGIYDAMNKGIKLAKGVWLYFLGSDDKLFDNNVLNRINKIEEEDKDLEVIYGNVVSDHFNGIYDGEFNNDKLFKQNICHQSVFLKRTVFKKIGIFNLRYKVWADWDHNLKWFLSQKIKKKYTDVLVAHYGEGGYSSSNWDGIFFEEKQINYLFYGYKILPFHYKIKVVKSESIKCLRAGKIKPFAKLLFFLPQILLHDSSENKIKVF